MTTKTLETTKEAKEFGLARCQELCKPDREICNPERSQEKGYWRKCLKFRLSLCLHHTYRQVPGLKQAAYISYCNNPQIPSAFCLGKKCKELPVIVVGEEQAVTFHFGAKAPKGPDWKQRAGKDDSLL